MRLNLDPMPAIKAAAVKTINEHFSAVSLRDMAHKWKRDTAASVLAGEVAPDEFAAEAELRGMSVSDFAALVASKPDALAARELARQTALLRIDACRTPTEIDAVKNSISS